jgi:hypothetical protein
MNRFELEQRVRAAAQPSGSPMTVATLQQAHIVAGHGIRLGYADDASRRRIEQGFDAICAGHYSNGWQHTIDAVQNLPADWSTWAWERWPGHHHYDLIQNLREEEVAAGGPLYRLPD